MTELEMNDLTTLKKDLPNLSKTILEKDDEFKKFFKYVFQACREGTIKTIPKEIVVYLLPICMSKFDVQHQTYARLFCEFLESQKNSK